MSRKQPCEPLARHQLTVQSLPISRAKVGERQAPIKTQARSATILPNFVGLKFQVHNGKKYDDITITEDMVGHKLGEFAPYVYNVPECLRRLCACSTANTVATGHERTSRISRRRINKGCVAHASCRSLGIICVCLIVLLIVQYPWPRIMRLVVFDIDMTSLAPVRPSNADNACPSGFQETQLCTSYNARTIRRCVRKHHR